MATTDRVIHVLLQSAKLSVDDERRDKNTSPSVSEKLREREFELFNSQGHPSQSRRFYSKQQKNQASVPCCASIGHPCLSLSKKKSLGRIGTLPSDRISSKANVWSGR